MSDIRHCISYSINIVKNNNYLVRDFNLYKKTSFCESVDVGGRMPRQRQPKLSSLENHPPNTAEVKIPQHHVEVIVASYQFILFVEERTQTVRFANEAGER